MAGNTELFLNFIKELNNNNINYAITGRTENYPEEIGSDVDIICQKVDLKILFNLIWGLKSEGINVVQLLQHEYGAYYFVISLKLEGKFRFLHPDICTDYMYKGRKLLSSEYLLDGSEFAKDDKGNKKSFKILKPSREFIYYFLKKLEKRDLKKEHFDHLCRVYYLEEEECRRELHRFFGKKETTFISEVFDNKSLEILNKRLYKLRSALHNNRHLNINEIYLNFRLKIKRILNPTGLWIAIMGPDGSGKSTIIQNLERDLIPCFRRKKYFHLFPKETIRDHSPTTNPHQANPRGFVTSLFKQLYFLLVYNLGYVFKVKPALIRSTFIIFDRYYHDIFADPQRYRFKKLGFLANIIKKIIPKPDLWFLLNADPLVIQNRKSEVTLLETERQVKRYKEVFNDLENGYIIDADQGVEDVTFAIEDIILTKLNNRTEDRHKGKLI